MTYTSLSEFIFLIILHNCNTQDFTCCAGSMRLSGSTLSNEGRVELCVSGQWKTVCGNHWSMNEARVICRQLGYSNQDALPLLSAAHGVGSGMIVEQVRCNGTERRLTDCTIRDSNDGECSHNEDAGVRCLCRSGDLRLQGSDIQGSGRVELCVNNVWGTVCDDSWSSTDTGVVCKQLGFSKFGGQFSCCTPYGQGTGPIHMDDVSCAGNESSLIDCPHISRHNCGHHEDVSIQCQLCRSGDLRLQGSTIQGRGRVEVCVNNIWGTICDDHWSSTDTGVVCRQLGFSEFDGRFPCCAVYGQGSGPIHMDDVSCVGSETSLIDCPHISRHNCGHGEDVSVQCQLLVCHFGDLRLQGSDIQGRGRVEVCVNNVWGTICDDSWSSTDTSVVCRQLGFSKLGGQSVSYSPAYGEGTGPIHMDDVSCVGSESSLVDCPHISDHNCGHREDVSVQCLIESCGSGDLRLQGSTIQGRGRVEVCVNNIWGTICDDHWSSTDTGVVCRQLGFSEFDGRFPCCAVYGQGSGPIHMDDVSCVGSETSLIDCPHISRHNCGHGEDVSVQCQCKLNL